MNLFQKKLLHLAGFKIKVMSYSILNQSEYEGIGAFFIFQYLFIFLGQIIFYTLVVDEIVFFAIFLGLIFCWFHSFFHRSSLMFLNKNISIPNLITLYTINCLIAIINPIPLVLFSFKNEILFEYYKVTGLTDLSFVQKMNYGLKFIFENEGGGIMLIMFLSLVMIHLFVFIYPIIIKLQSKNSIYNKYNKVYEQVKN